MRSGRFRLQDIAEAIAGIEQIVSDVDLEAFGASWPTERAVERGLEIISEASRGIDDAEKTMFPQVAWPQIAGIGNILHHEHHRVERRVIWHNPSAPAATKERSGGPAEGN